MCINTMLAQPAFAKTMASRLVIFDLDETLIHAAEQPLAREPDFTVGPFPVYKRPFVKELLIDCARDCTLAVWTSATRDHGYRNQYPHHPVVLAQFENAAWPAPDSTLSVPRPRPSVSSATDTRAG